MSTPEPPSAQDRLIVVTGGNRGIGLALVELLADGGNKVIFTSRDPARGIDARRRADRGATGPPHQNGDLRPGLARLDRCVCQRLVDRGEPIDAVINNAGNAAPTGRSDM